MPALPPDSSSLFLISSLSLLYHGPPPSRRMPYHSPRNGHELCLLKSKLSPVLLMLGVLVLSCHKEASTPKECYLVGNGCGNTEKSWTGGPGAWGDQCVANHMWLHLGATFPYITETTHHTKISEPGFWLYPQLQGTNWQGPGRNDSWCRLHPTYSSSPVSASTESNFAWLQLWPTSAWSAPGRRPCPSQPQACSAGPEALCLSTKAHSRSGMRTLSCVST